MTALQQSIAHLVLVVVAVVAIVVLQVTGNLTELSAGFVLAVTGFGNIGVAGLPTNPPVTVTPVPAPAPSPVTVVPPTT
jgi:hypothetical protein